jgi:hypothetical protein
MLVVLLAEFIDVGKKQRALDALYDVIKSKRHRTWQKIHEPIMEKYLQLCVELKKSHVAKEGLYQYKNICQQVCSTLICNYMSIFFILVVYWIVYCLLPSKVSGLITCINHLHPLNVNFKKKFCANVCNEGYALNNSALNDCVAH